MSVIIKSLLLIGFLVSCSTTTEESRYRNTENLERPPTVISSSPAREQRIVDNSSIPKKKDSAGLGEDIYLGTQGQLNIKQPFDEAWDTLNRALKQGDIKITDHERDKGHLYVNYGSSGFFDKALSFLKDGHKESNYLLLVEENGAETTITVTMSNATEQGKLSGDQDGYYDAPVDASAELLDILYKIIRNDLVGK
ncbi:MAG: outer membrane protein assembly factor BamC [Methylobacter sp.]|nr:outer membrane protein assembly factor BamC [Methylobacter sp.]